MSGLASNRLSANRRTSKTRSLDAQLFGFFVSRAAISGFHARDLSAFVDTLVEVLQRSFEDLAKPLEERLAKAKARYRLTE